MPIGVGTAIGIGGAVLGAGASIYGASKSASAQKAAAQQASDTSLQVAQENNALYKQIYDQNTALASPYYNNGLLAGNALTDLLLGTHTYNPAIVSHPSTPGGGTFPQFPSGGTGTGGATGPSDYASWAGQAWNAIAPQIGPKRTAEALAISDPVARLNFITSHFDPDEAAIYNQWVQGHPASAATATPTAPALPANGAAVPSALGAASTPARDNINASRAARGLPPLPARGTAAGTGTGTGTGAAGGGAGTAQGAWDQFRQGTNYQWRLSEGQKALDSSAAAHGGLYSGAAEKATIQYGQNFASNELSNYMNLLAGQQASGLSAAGAVMGVGTNYAGNVAAQNTSAANAAANAALASGNANASQWGAIGNGVGQLGGALWQYGMGGYGGSAPSAPTSGGYNVSSGTGNYFAAHPFG